VSWLGWEGWEGSERVRMSSLTKRGDQLFTSAMNLRLIGQTTSYDKAAARQYQEMNRRFASSETANPLASIPCAWFLNS
jgi:hypothetical protein